MKKFLAVTISAVLVLAMALTVFAGKDDEAVKAAELNLAAEFLINDADGKVGIKTFQMRGFTASLDGKYVYGGFLQYTTGDVDSERCVYKFDVENGYAPVGTYKPESTDNGLYCKGLACDDRGILYVGITHDGNLDIAVAAVDSEMHEIDRLDEIIAEKTADITKTGINGIAVQKIGEKYLLYVVTAYHVDTIRCYDVTDPEDIKLNTEFGTNGVLDLAFVAGDAPKTSDPNYIAVDPEGTIYLTYKSATTNSGKGSNVAQIKWDSDLKKYDVVDVEVKEAYGICEAGDYVFVATFDGANSSVVVLDKADITADPVATLTCEAHGITSFSDIAFGNGVLFVGDHGDNAANEAGKVLVAAIELTEEEEIDDTTEEESEPEDESIEESEEESEDIYDESEEESEDIYDESEEESEDIYDESEEESEEESVEESVEESETETETEGEDVIKTSEREFGVLDPDKLNIVIEGGL
ncbi:MAG: hypothetical protein IJT49_00975, partial [Clostridia bacterium]|nr:hypothetical protein [Clostridia bacterium]